MADMIANMDIDYSDQFVRLTAQVRENVLTERCEGYAFARYAMTRTPDLDTAVERTHYEMPEADTPYAAGPMPDGRQVAWIDGAAYVLDEQPLRLDIAATVDAGTAGIWCRECGFLADGSDDLDAAVADHRELHTCRA